MAKIVKNSDAPEGNIDFGFGMVSFTVSNSKGYTTDDPEIIEQARRHEWLDIEKEQTPEEITAVAVAESDKLNALADARDAANEQHATKDPLESAVEIPQTVEDLEGQKSSRAKRGGKN